MSWLDAIAAAADTALGESVGVVWSAATGTVDPWTKAAIAYNSGVGSLGSSASDATVAAVASSAPADVTAALTSIGADPSQAATGLQNSLAQLNPFSANSPLNPANWSSTEILLLGAAIVAAILILGLMVRR